MKAYFERFRDWWAGLAQRERQALSAGAAALALIVIYLALWQPVTQSRSSRETALTEARALAIRLEALALEVQRNRGAGGTIAGANQSLLAVVDQSGKASSLGKTPSRLQPEGDNTVRVWVEDVPFEAVMRWLNDLQTRYGVRVDNADIERQSAAGLVNVRLTLVR
ncbi:MAG: type II secretion system protein M [Hydrocarboniphaga effusa]|nr:type II secretion system protein M [Hydrocarboniphaga effusa]